MTHGTRTCYVYHGCRCDDCRAANNAYVTYGITVGEKVREVNTRGVVPADPFIDFLEDRGHQMRDVYTHPTSQFRWMTTGRMTVSMAERLAAEHGVTPWAIWGEAWNDYDPVSDAEFHDEFCEDGHCPDVDSVGVA